MNGLGSITISIDHTEFSRCEDFFETMTMSGWKFDIDKEIIFNPDIDDPYSDWQHFMDNEQESVIIKAIKQLNERGKVGLSMSYDDSFGWLVIIHKDFSKIEFINEVGRKMITQLKVTDFSFHINYIVDSFTRAKISISEIDCNWFR